MSGDPSKEIPARLKEWLGKARAGSSKLLKNPTWLRFSSSLRKRFPWDFSWDPKKFSFEGISRHQSRIQWALIVIGTFLLADLSARTVGMFLKTANMRPPQRSSGMASRRSPPQEDYDAILRRNIFNVEGKIPEPFDQGQLDCFAQAKPTTQRLTLLGTIVMNDDLHSVALVQEEAASNKVAVKKDEVFFDGKFQALKVERKKLCFQVRATQDLEYLEIPDDASALGLSGPALSGTDGITPVSETEFVVKRNYLDSSVLNLNEILQTARAVPFVDQRTGKFKGFLVQTIESSSPFAQLGVRQGDILTGVNNIVLDNAGKGLEAFQTLRDAPKIALKVIRGGQETTLSYDVK